MNREGNKLTGLSKWETLLIVFLLFFLTRPYFFWAWYGNLFVSVLVSTVAMLIIWKHTGKLSSKQKSVFLFYIIVWFFYLINEFSKGARLGVVAYIPYVLLGYVPFMKKDILKNIFNTFTIVYAVLIGISMVSWVAAMAGMISPIGQLGDDIESMVADQKSYIVYPFSLVSTSNISDFTRFCGFYDEPGVVGTIAGLICCAFRYNMKDWRCIVVFISGIMSTSMFFYGLTAVYWLAQLLFVKKRTGSVILLIVAASLFYIGTKNNEAVSFLVWDRFEWNSKSGGFVGSTRGGEREIMAMEKIKASGEIWFGVKDKEAYWSENFGSSSIYNAFAMYGIIFVTLYIVWLLLAGYHYKVNKWDYLLYCFVVIGCLYQRPSLFNLPYTFLFVSVARYYEYQLDINNTQPKRRFLKTNRLHSTYNA